MFSKSLVLALAMITMMPFAAYAQDEEQLDWHKITITCSRTRTKSKRRIGGKDSDGEERTQHITVKASVKNGMKVPIQGLQLVVVGINEKAAKNRKDRKPVAGKEGKPITLNVEPYKKVTVEALKYDVRVRYETVAEIIGKDVKKTSTVKGETYMGYVAFLRDGNDELLMVKAENKKIERIARELGLIEKGITFDRHGVVQKPEKDE